MESTFAPQLGALERQRRIVDQVMFTDPLAAHRRVLEKALLIDPVPRRHEFLAKITGADRMAQISRALQPARPDPFARQRRVFEQMAKQRNQGYDRMIALLTGPRDPFAAQRRTFDKLLSEGPLARYERIVESFNALVPPLSLPVIEDVEISDGLPPALVDWASVAMVVHLLSIIHVCNSLITGGVTSERLETLVLEAIGLAIHLYVSG
jgi:hypothetical protein